MEMGFVLMNYNICLDQSWNLKKDSYQMTVVLSEEKMVMVD